MMRPLKQAALVLRLRGGLGNQLFQYAAARSLSLRSQVPLLLDKSSSFARDVYGRQFELDALRISYDNIVSETFIQRQFMSEACRITLKIREYYGMKFLGRYFDRKIFNLPVSHPLLFESYCQSYLYFSDIEQLLRKELEFKSVPIGLDNEVVSAMKETTSVCLHIRRLLGVEADGHAPPAVTRYYGACNLKYYRRSIRELAERHGKLHIFVFSDNVEWALKNASTLRSDYGHVFVVEDNDCMRSFYLMRQCKHFIIANSTYSWWAAWLGVDPDKTVCVPSVWNRGQRKFPRDLIPEPWNIIDAE